MKAAAAAAAAATTAATSTTSTTTKAAVTIPVACYFRVFCLVLLYVHKFNEQIDRDETEGRKQGRKEGKKEWKNIVARKSVVLLACPTSPSSCM